MYIFLLKKELGLWYTPKISCIIRHSIIIRHQHNVYRVCYKPDNVYQIENNQKNQDTCLLLYHKSKSISKQCLIYFFVVLDICIAWKICTFWAYSFLILKSTLVSSKTTLVGNLHYREKGEQTDSTRDID